LVHGAECSCGFEEEGTSAKAHMGRTCRSMSLCKLYTSAMQVPPARRDETTGTRIRTVGCTPPPRNLRFKVGGALCCLRVLRQQGPHVRLPSHGQTYTWRLYIRHPFTCVSAHDGVLHGHGAHGRADEPPDVKPAPTISKERPVRLRGSSKCWHHLGHPKRLLEQITQTQPVCECASLLHLVGFAQVRSEVAHG